jgi:protein-ribulosamine 3-kinase
VPAQRFLNDRYRRLIEQMVSQHRGRPWVARTVENLNERASHPCAVLTDEEFSVFVKIATATDATEQFTIERAGLQHLTDLAGVRTPAPIGTGIITTDDGAILVLEAILTVERTAQRWRDLGRTLAQIHQVSGERFGLDTDGYFGPLVQDNRPVEAASWCAFYGERRLRPRLAGAIESGHLPASVAARVETLISRLPELCGPDVSPTLLHGDAQQNNFLTTAGGAVPIDPAVYFGHPEIDLALIDYFAPVPADVFDGYRDVRPIDQGFRERRSLWRIFGYLAVVTVAGPTYLGGLVAALDEYVP